ncbi:aromatic prenyltransferase [Thelonectria olida]|uniref:Aromatic prenyltransferase n=1 Tax=Thelonectria olida TaxID=1576542 RepID=A0A9P8W1F9_9HYPO|nr:aromatic prenyltransferase [Thelonectria olida]
MAPGYPSEETKPWHLVKARTEGLSNPHQQYWYQTVGYVLSEFLLGAEYSRQSQVTILHQFANLVAPHLGVAPLSGLPCWKSFMTDNHTPVELSWDFHTGSCQPMIRYSIEPIELDAGTATNPHNDGASAAFRQAAIKAFPETDTTWFDHFQICFGQGWTDDRPEGHRSTIFWAFDLKESAITNKAYFFPGTVAHATHRPTLDVVLNAIHSAPRCSPETLTSIEAFANYANQCPNLGLEMDMLAVDLVDINKSRLKVYFRDRRTDFGTVKKTLSLGGQMQDGEFDMGVQRLKRLWDALFDTQDLSDDVPLPRRDHRTAGILYNVEFKMHTSTPKVKVYIPVRHYAKSDAQILSALTGFLTDEVGGQSDLHAAPVYATHFAECLQNTL